MSCERACQGEQNGKFQLHNYIAPSSGEIWSKRLTIVHGFQPKTDFGQVAMSTQPLLVVLHECPPVTAALGGGRKLRHKHQLVKLLNQLGDRVCDLPHLAGRHTHCTSGVGGGVWTCT